MGNKKVLIIYTGGTIGMAVEPETQSLVPIQFESIEQSVPELKKLDVDLTTHSFDKLVDSSNMNPDLWIEIATKINENYELFDGFVVLHGSDTMAYTASAISFLFEGQNKPIIFTGSQLPIGTIRTDGKENLITAIQIASSYKKGKAIVPEVGLYFENTLYRGNRTHKYNSEHFDAFESPNYPTLAKAGINLHFHQKQLLKPGKQVVFHNKFNANVGILHLYPGISESYVKSIMLNPDLEGLVLYSFGSGNTPTYPWFLKLLRNAIKNGCLILNITQCDSGKVKMGKYKTSVSIKRMGVISGNDMTIEAAITKLMFVLGSESSKKRQIRLLSKSLRGEMTVK